MSTTMQRRRLGPIQRDGRLTLRGFRLAVGLTQSEVGQRIGVVRQTIAGWERGNPQYPMTVRYLFALARVYGCRASDLVECLDREHDDREGE